MVLEKTSFLKIEEVNMKRVVGIRTAAKEESMGGGKGFQKCLSTALWKVGCSRHF